MLSLMYVGDLCYWIWEVSKAVAHTQLVTGALPAVDTKSRKELIQTKSGYSSADKPVSPSDSTLCDSSSIPACAEGEIETDSRKICSSDKDPSSESGACDKDRTPSLEPVETISKKLEGVELDSTRTLETVASSLQEATPPSQASASTRTLQHTPLDLYHVIIHTCEEGSVSRWLSEFDPHKCGLEMLAKYIDTARGPLKGQGWEYARAVKLLVMMKKAAASASISAK